MGKKELGPRQVVMDQILKTRLELIPVWGQRSEILLFITSRKVALEVFTTFYRLIALQWWFVFIK